ncbi:MAG: hypothetical protein ACC619_08000, partial [Paracoccaceae bacterium]
MVGQGGSGSNKTQSAVGKVYFAGRAHQAGENRTVMEGATMAKASTTATGPLAGLGILDLSRLL